MKRIALFGHFDSSNFGNESTLQAVLHHMRRFYPVAAVMCICTGPEFAAAAYQIDAVPISDVFSTVWVPRNWLTKALRKLCVLLSEPYRWIRAYLRLRGTDMLMIPGTGLLTDAYGLLTWGPYSLFKWSIIAKLCRCKLAFVSVGAGPVHTTLGRCFVRLMLRLAEFRSYRDESTVAFLKSIGVEANASEVYPDLAFSLPEHVLPQKDRDPGLRPVVGLGVMVYSSEYSIPGAADGVYSNYLESLARFAEWLLARGYNIRLLCGDVSDTQARQDFRGLLRGRVAPADQARIVDEPARSVEEVLAQIAATDIVVATRFHNLIFSLLCTKPVISISFHHKCESLMRAMEMSEYCLDIGSLSSDGLISKFCSLEATADSVKPIIRERARQFRRKLEQQYAVVFEAGDTRLGQGCAIVPSH